MAYLVMDMGLETPNSVELTIKILKKQCAVILLSQIEIVITENA